MNFKKICVLGLGYIGLPTASTFAAQDVEVVGVDVNPKIIAVLQNGDIHIHEPGLRTVVQAAMKSGNLKISWQPEPADAFIIAVPTPFYDDKRADLSYVTAAAESIVPYLRPGNLVVLESTSPPRTTVDVVAPILERSGLRAGGPEGDGFFLAYSPERVLPGQILRELIENARVIGGIDPRSSEAGRDLYSLFVRGEIILTNATTAEMVKLMENTYRDVNIAIANEFSRLAERMGINIWEAITLANRHPRVNILRPGPGVGGHCISVDPWFLVEAAPDITRLIRTAREVNDSQPNFVVQIVSRALGDSLEGRRIGVLGLAYKPDVDDVRESPAIDVAQQLARCGAQVLAYEPYKTSNTINGVNLAATLEEVLAQAEALILLVGHKSLTGLDPQEVSRLTSARVVVDAAGGWNGPDWEAAGFHYCLLGDGKNMC